MASIASSLKMANVYSKGLSKIKKVITSSASKLVSSGMSVASELASSGMELNAFKQTSEIALTTFLGDKERAKAYVDDMQTFAKTTPFKFPDLLATGQNLIAKGMDEEYSFAVVKAIGEATAGTGGGSERFLQIADVFERIQESGRLSMQEVEQLLSANIPALQIFANQAGLATDEMKNLISKGVIDANTAISWLVEGIENGTKGIAGETAKMSGMMADLKATWTGTLDSFHSEKSNAGAQLLELYMAPLTELVQSVTNFFERLPSLIGPGVNAFIPLIAVFTSLFETGKIDSFFLALNVGLQIAAWGLTGLVHGALWLWDVIAEYWPEITAMLIAWAAIYIPALITSLWGMISPIILAAGSFWLAHWPIILIILLIGGLVLMIRNFGVTTDQIIGFVVGIFYSLVAAVKNTFALLWNIIVGFVEFFWNIFNDPIYAVKKLFFDLVTNIMDYFGSLTNGIVKSLNWIIEKINSISQTEIKLIPEYDSALLKQLEPQSNKKVFDSSKYKMDHTDLGTAFEEGYQSGVGLMAKFTDPFNTSSEDRNPFNTSSEDQNPFDPSQSNFFGQGMPTDIDRVGEVGRINDQVDISSEDLKMMRELAEMENIQNYVTLTPTVSVKTGDINNGYDIETIIARIEKSMAEEISSSAEGVFA